MRKDHPYISGMKHKFQISPLLQSHTLEFAHQLPFDRAMGLLNTALPAAQMGGSQSQRLMQYFGTLAELEQQLIEPGFTGPPETETVAEALYAQVDGGYLFTDDGYQETKVGRVFKGSQIKQVSSDNEAVGRRIQLDRSDYIANLGHYEGFTHRFDQLLNKHLDQASDYHLVLISDGADWIANWQRESFPEATMILDFYHALEHLGNYAKMVFRSTAKRDHWMEKRKEELLTGQLDQVIKAITEKQKGRRASIGQKAQTLIAYYEKNRYRMNYQEYLGKGFCIGSGAIESAIGTLLQQRCKLVGQRWTDRVEPVLNVRAMFLSKKKNKLLQIINQQMSTKSAA